jgi:hypothetical protein
MAEFEIDQTELDDLKRDLENLDLSPNQRKVLNAMIRIAGDLANGEPAGDESEEPRAFAADFAGAFTPQQAGLIVQYAGAAGSGVYHAAGATEAHGSGAAIAAMITR